MERLRSATSPSAVLDPSKGVDVPDQFSATCDGAVNCTGDFSQIAFIPSNRLEAIFVDLVVCGGGNSESPTQPANAAPGATAFSPQTLLAKILGCMGESVAQFL